MSQIVCPSCGSVCPSSSSYCSRCGYKIQLSIVSKKWIIAAMAVMVVAILMALVIPAMYMCEIQHYTVTDSYYAYDDNQRLQEYYVREHVPVLTHGYSMLVNNCTDDIYEIEVNSSSGVFVYITVAFTIFAAAILFALINKPETLSKAWMAPLGAFCAMVLQGFFYLDSIIDVTNISKRQDLRGVPKLGVLWWIVLGMLVCSIILAFCARRAARPKIPSSNNLEEAEC